MLKRAKERSSHVSSVHVLWMCSTEFEADQHQGISFVRDDSFVMLAKPAVQTGERYSIQAKKHYTLIEIELTNFVNLNAMQMANLLLLILLPNKHQTYNSIRFR